MRERCFTGRVHPRLTLLKPVALEVVIDAPGWYIATEVVSGATTFPVCGIGEDEAEACGDFWDALVDYYDLVVEGARSNVYDACELAELRGLIVVEEAT